MNEYELLSKKSLFPPEPLLTVVFTGPAPTAETVTVKLSPGATDDLDVLMLILVAAYDLTVNSKAIMAASTIANNTFFKIFF